MSTATQTISNAAIAREARNPAQRTVFEDYGILIADARTGVVEASNPEAKHRRVDDRPSQE
jgi:hypothetical protein